MLSFKRNLRILATVAAFSLLALAAGCRGFFVNPTLTSITVAPTSASIVEGQTQQINATGNLRRRQHQGSDRKRYLDDIRVGDSDRQQRRSGNRGFNHIESSRDGNHYRHLRDRHRQFHDYGKHRAADGDRYQHHHPQPGRRTDRCLHRAGNL